MFMTKKSWIILGSTLGGVAATASVLTPVLLVPNIYKVNDLKTFTQNYTPVRSNDAYGDIQDGSHPSGKLLFFTSLYYTIILTQPDLLNIKTNGLHNSLSFALQEGDSTYASKISYSNTKVTILSSDKKNIMETKDFVFNNSTSNVATITGPFSPGYDIIALCPIWQDGNINWNPY